MNFISHFINRFKIKDWRLDILKNAETIFLQVIRKYQFKKVSFKVLAFRHAEAIYESPDMLLILSLDGYGIDNVSVTVQKPGTNKKELEFCFIMQYFDSSIQIDSLSLNAEAEFLLKHYSSISKELSEENIVDLMNATKELKEKWISNKYPTNT